MKSASISDGLKREDILSTSDERDDFSMLPKRGCLGCDMGCCTFVFYGAVGYFVIYDKIQEDKDRKI